MASILVPAPPPTAELSSSVTRQIRESGVRGFDSRLCESFLSAKCYGFYAKGKRQQETKRHKQDVWQVFCHISAAVAQ